MERTSCTTIAPQTPHQGCNMNERNSEESSFCSFDLTFLLCYELRQDLNVRLLPQPNVASYPSQSDPKVFWNVNNDVFLTIEFFIQIKPGTEYLLAQGQSGSVALVLDAALLTGKMDWNLKWGRAER